MRKKCLYLFNKKTPLYAGLGSKQQNISNCQATYQKLYLLFENSGSFFHRSNVDSGIGLTPPLPPPLTTTTCLFSFYKYHPLHNKHNFWMPPCWSKMSVQDVIRNFFYIWHICFIRYILSFLADIIRFLIKTKIQVDQYWRVFVNPFCTKTYSCMKLIY